MAEKKPYNSVDYGDLEVECAQVLVRDGTNQAAVYQGAVNAALTNDTVGTDAEDGYLVVQVDISGTLTEVKVPFWLDDA